MSSGPDRARPACQYVCMHVCMYMYVCVCVLERSPRLTSRNKPRELEQAAVPAEEVAAPHASANAPPLLPLPRP